jgi:methylaspartate mutase epsilon subunit
MQDIHGGVFSCIKKSSNIRTRSCNEEEILEIRQKKWEEKDFFDTVEDAVSQWPTGKEIDLDEAIAYHKSLPNERVAVKKVIRAQKEGKTPLACAVTGKPTVEQQIEELQYVGQEADYFLMVSDSMSRRARFKEAAEGLQKSISTNTPHLNGFPYAIHGVKTSRSVLESVNCPIYTPLPTIGCQLAALTTIASGVTQFGFSFFTNLTAEARVSAEDLIISVQFCDRMLGYFQERGVPVMKRSLTISTAAPCPPCISLVASIVDCLMSAEQGLKYFGIFYPLNSCIRQDIAAMKITPKLHEYYVNKLGYKDVDLSLGVGTANNTCAFPKDQAKGLSRVLYDAVIAAYAKAVRLHHKTGQEAFGIPTKESALEAVKAVKMMFEMIRNETFPEDQEFEQETRTIEMETRAIMDKILELGDGDVVKGLVKALDLGFMDVPYAVGNITAGKCLAVRDGSRSVRFLDHGNLPFSKEIIAFNKERIAERKKRDKQNNWEMIATDLKAEGDL